MANSGRGSGSTLWIPDRELMTTPRALKSLLASNGEPLRHPSEILRDSQKDLIVVQDFCPLAESLDWELGHLYFHERGSRAFTTTDDNVPFTVNNDGNLSINAAAVLFSSLVEAEQAKGPEETILVLEIGVGVGLFARYFLDAFRSLCKQHGKDYYDRVCYVAADSSSQMLDDLTNNGILSNHSGRFRTAQVEATAPQFPFLTSTNQSEAKGCFRAVFLNYLLDNLPAAIVRRDGDTLDQLYVRTCLARGAEPEAIVGMTAKEITQRATSPEKRALIDLYPLFVLQSAFRPVDMGKIPYGEFAAKFCKGQGESLLHSYGAVQCLDRLLDLLHEDGLILFSDYGVTDTTASSADLFLHQHFSGSVAIGLNFSLLRSYFEDDRRCQWVEPTEDNESLRSRLVGRALAPKTVSVFRERFSKTAYDRAHEPEKAAWMYQQQGRHEASIFALNEALQRQPYNWRLMNEVAKFLSFQLGNHSAGLEMARAGLALNPTFTDLWNTFGDCLFGLDRVDEANQAYHRALAIDPTDVRGYYNLAWVFARQNDNVSALQATANGLSHDKMGLYRSRLLQKQAEILSKMDERNLKKARFAADRSSSLIEPLPAKGKESYALQLLPK